MAFPWAPRSQVAEVITSGRSRWRVKEKTDGTEMKSVLLILEAIKL